MDEKQRERRSGRPVGKWAKWTLLGGRNQRKMLLLRALGHFYAVPVTPREVTLWQWDAMRPEERARTSFGQEWLRNRVALQRLADKRRYAKPYAVVVGDAGPGVEARYRLSRKGDRVRRKIARGTLAGWSDFFGRLHKHSA